MDIAIARVGPIDRRQQHQQRWQRRSAFVPSRGRASVCVIIIVQDGRARFRGRVRVPSLVAYRTSMFDMGAQRAHASKETFAHSAFFCWACTHANTFTGSTGVIGKEFVRCESRCGGVLFILSFLFALQARRACFTIIEQPNARPRCARRRSIGAIATH